MCRFKKWFLKLLLHELFKSILFFFILPKDFKQMHNIYFTNKICSFSRQLALIIHVWKSKVNWLRHITQIVCKFWFLVFDKLSYFIKLSVDCCKWIILYLDRRWKGFSCWIFTSYSMYKKYINKLINKNLEFCLTLKFWNFLFINHWLIFILRIQVTKNSNIKTVKLFRPMCNS